MIKEVILFFIDKTQRLSTRAAIFIISITIILLVNDIVGFSFHYQKDRQIQELEKLSSIISNPATDSVTRSYAVLLREQIFKRQNVITYLLSLPFSKSSTPSKIANDNIIKTQPIINDSGIKNTFWTYTSSGGIYFIFAIITFPLFIAVDKKKGILHVISTSILVISSMTLMGFFFTWLFGFIPKISSVTWVWNYILNFILQASLLSLLLYVAIKGPIKQ